MIIRRVRTPRMQETKVSKTFPRSSSGLLKYRIVKLWRRTNSDVTGRRNLSILKPLSSSRRIWVKSKNEDEMIDRSIVFKRLACFEDKFR